MQAIGSLGVERQLGELAAAFYIRRDRYYGCTQPAECLCDALENSATSVAFPAISTGAFGYPFEPATDVALSVVRDTLPGLEAVRHIRFVWFSRSDLVIYEEKQKDFFHD